MTETINRLQGNKENVTFNPNLVDRAADIVGAWYHLMGLTGTVSATMQ